MKNWLGPRRKIALVTLVCSLVTALCALFMLTHSVRPSIGKPYERLTVEDASSYMSYEKNYIILDVRSADEYQEGHMQGAVNIPYDSLVGKAPSLLRDMEQTIYVYGATEEASCAGAQKLSDMGYKGIAEIGSYDSWTRQQKSTETENLMSSPVE